MSSQVCAPREESTLKEKARIEGDPYDPPCAVCSTGCGSRDELFPVFHLPSGVVDTTKTLKARTDYYLLRAKGLSDEEIFVRLGFDKL